MCFNPFYDFLFFQSQNFPSRPAPIKEQTVLNYLLDAAREGFQFDWTRFCDEVGLTREIFSAIQGAILKVGTTEKLRSIKDELPEAVSLINVLEIYPPFYLFLSLNYFKE